ncbi:unnamed protein product [Effrenium voratum]|uniref:Uncharacterized protein n=1 Tax=Effrenium voratum TaxID=2562239 RepID=A0AA36N005_9DINO|nr:unnamed protein product [Effrenium voratum]CAJ1435456.1 unnamed protein product [Effrenium voratum]
MASGLSGRDGQAMAPAWRAGTFNLKRGGDARCQSARSARARPELPPCNPPPAGWKEEQCPNPQCRDFSCIKWHSPQEWRCRGGESCPRPESCRAWHVKVEDICQTRVIDLLDERLSEAELHRFAKGEEGAKYLRAVVYGFAGIQLPAVALMLKDLPMLRELHLPDAQKEDCHLQVKELLMQIRSKCPGLREVSFANAQVRTWDLVT